MSRLFSTLGYKLDRRRLRTIVITGTPRGGTTMMAECLRALGPIGVTGPATGSRFKAHVLLSYEKALQFPQITAGMLASWCGLQASEERLGQAAATIEANRMIPSAASRPKVSALKRR